ncbi:LamG-like jellyroll fold domain-containing protein [Leptothoe sp. EHU-05/26/07-4]
MSDVIGQGRLVVTNPAAPESARHFGVQISQLQIQFYDLSDNTQLTALEWWALVQESLGGAANVQVPGHIVLTGLPATPSPAFVDISVGVSDVAGQSVFTLTVRQAAPFGVSPSGHVTFQDLDLTFTQMAADVAVSGGLKVILLFDLLEQPVALIPAWDDGQLVFNATGPKVSVGQVGVIEETEIAVKTLAHPWPSLQTLYSFEAVSGNIIRDASGQVAIDLTVYTPDLVTLERGALLTQADTEIATAPRDARQPLPAPRPVRRLIQACQDTQEISVVLWFKPALQNQSGPDRLITLSSDFSEHNFLVGQQKDHYVVRLRTTVTDKNGRINKEDVLHSPNKSVQLRPTCLVFTRSMPIAGEPNAYLYLDGKPVDSATVGGDFSTWGDFELAIANEFKDPNRSWQGEFYRIAVYNKALTPEQVRQLYYPQVLTTGALRLTDMPAPLDQPLATEIVYEDEFSLIQSKATTPRLATPQFQFDRITLSWKKVGPNPWALEQNSSAVEATLWQQNKFTLGTKDNSGQPEQFLPLIPQPNQPLTFILQDLGEITVENFELQPSSFDNRPQWELIADVRESEINLPSINRPFDFKTDFKLTDLDLVIEYVEDPLRAVAEDRVLLTGNSLNRAFNFYGHSIEDQFVLRSAILYQLPFSLTLGPIHEPCTTVVVADQVKVCPTPGCRQIMSLDTLIELSGAGFVATVNGTFPWEDEFGRRQVLSVPEFTTFTIPPTPNALLAEATAQLSRYANEVFAPVVQSKEDFYIIDVSGQSVLIYGSQARFPETQTTILPTVLRGVETIKSARGLFELIQSEQNAQLILSLSGRSDSEIASDYDNFLGQLSNRSVRPSSFEQVRRRLAKLLPVPITQALQYVYSYDAQTVDLVGGMRLRVEYQNYQFVHPVDRTADTGFVSSGTAYYTLHFETDGAQDFLGFDPFLSAVPTAVESTSQATSGLVDLLRPGNRKAFYRLMYPDEFLPSQGRIGAERVALLIGANDFNTLEEATTYYRNPSAARSQPPTNIALVYFRGRATVVPEIAIFVQEQPAYVPVGTTLRQVAERYGQAALRARPQRLVYEGVENTPDYRFINLGNNTNALDLPLLQGDRIYF